MTCISAADGYPYSTDENRSTITKLSEHGLHYDCLMGHGTDWSCLSSVTDDPLDTELG